jgi:hypothetical protein
MKSEGDRFSRLRWTVWLVGLAVASWLAAFGNSEPIGEIVEPAPRVLALTANGKASAGTGTPNKGTDQTSEASLVFEEVAIPLARLKPRKELIKPNSPRADLFAFPTGVSPAPQTLAPAPSMVAQKQPPDHGFRVIGMKKQEGVWTVYLSQGERTFMVQAGDVLESAWRVDRIEPPGMTWTHVPTGESQAIAIGGFQ